MLRFLKEKKRTEELASVQEPYLCYPLSEFQGPSRRNEEDGTETISVLLIF